MRAVNTFEELGFELKQHTQYDIIYESEEELNGKYYRVSFDICHKEFNIEELDENGQEIDTLFDTPFVLVKPILKQIEELQQQGCNHTYGIGTTDDGFTCSLCKNDNITEYIRIEKFKYCPECGVELNWSEMEE